MSVRAVPGPEKTAALGRTAGVATWYRSDGPAALVSIGLGLAFPARSNTALPNVRTATAARVRTNAPASVAAGLVHRYSNAFAVGAGLLVLTAWVLAVLVWDGPAAAEAAAGNPAHALG